MKRDKDSLTCSEDALSVNSESDLLHRLLHGDRQVLGELFQLHSPRLRRTLRFRLDRRLWRRISLDDVLQEAYLAASARIDHYLAKPEISLFVWLRQILEQTLIDVHRRHLLIQKRDARRDLSIDSPCSNDTSELIAERLISDLSSPSQTVSREEVSRVVEEALGAIDPIDQEVLAMRHFEGLTNNEVAESLGVSAKAASMRYMRALDRLRRTLAKLSGFRGMDPE
jgi:RNA polymerase sigma-70 factor (ECF subfamily)